MSARSSNPGNSTNRNWPLLLGGSLVLFMALVAIMGPWLAPHDPMERTLVLLLGKTAIPAPFPLFTPGFPLGSDAEGRDLLSRLLWAVQPTLLVVVLAALIRLAVGISIGLIAGGIRGRTGILASNLIGIAIIVPTLVVALAVIAFVGIERGLTAFLWGLSLTGWAESARIIEAQVRIIRSQPFIESAQATGASPLRILFRHIYSNIAPLVSPLFASEMSNTLTITAALGFLGYYIGGGVWETMISDWQARNISGTPELGQMLSAALASISRPMPMFVVGSVVTLLILGFNLLGEGLRRRAAQEVATRPTRFGQRMNQLGEAMEDWFAPTFAWINAHRWLRFFLILFVLALIGLRWWHSDFSSLFSSQPTNTTSSISIPGGHFWGSERANAQGTFDVNFSGPITSTALWSYHAGSVLTGGPVIAHDGTLFVNNKTSLLALNADGTIRWQAETPAEPVRSPALGANGEIYVADRAGGLTAFTADGTSQWHFTREQAVAASTGPIVGADGTIYYPRRSRVQAVSSAGEGLWLAPGADNYAESMPRLSADGRLIFIKDLVIELQQGKGSKLNFAVGAPGTFGDPYLLTGGNGFNYYRESETFVRWQWHNAVPAEDARLTWDIQRFGVFVPLDSGVTSQNNFWLLYTSGFGGTRTVWLNKAGIELQNILAPHFDTRLIGIDDQQIMYLCGTKPGGKLSCYGISPFVNDIAWSIDLPVSGTIVGGALSPGRLYVATDKGELFAIGNQ